MGILFIRVLVIALAVMATVASMVWIVEWPRETVLPGAITSGVLTAVLLILDYGNTLRSRK